MNNKLTILFIPVSDPQGMGEYMRSLILAEALSEQFPGADIRFILSREAPYASDCPFPVSLVDDSPTIVTHQVNPLIEAYQPHLVVFDASGRAKQLSCAHKCGAAVVFISQHRRKRRRGMKWQRARVTDLHLVAQPDFIMGDIGLLDRLKCRWLKLPQPQTIGPVFLPPSPAVLQRVIDGHGIDPRGYVLLAAGSGGHRVGQVLATDIFAAAARQLVEKLGLACVLVAGPNYPKADVEMPGVHWIRSLEPREFISLLQGARAAVLSGGDTLLQAIALKVPTLAVPVAKDQPARINLCVRQKLVSVASPDALSGAIVEFMAPEAQLALKKRLTCFESGNGLELALEKITPLLAARCS